MLNWFLSSSVLIAALLLLRQLLKGRLDPRLTYALWLLCALRVLIPVSLFSAPVTVSGFADKTDLSEVVETVREALSPKETFIGSLPQGSDITLEKYAESWKDSGLHVYDASHFTEEELSEIREENPAFYRDTANQPIKLTVERLIGQYTFWDWIYRAGFFAVLLALLVCNSRFARHLKASRRPYDGPLPLPCKLPVYVVDALPSPCLFGLFRPVIYLNRAAVESVQLRHILTHELTHCRHLDHWWAVVRCACLAMQWFNPLVWVAAYLSRQDCESACDASVVRALGEEERLGYGRTLVDMIAAGQHRGSALFEAATTMTGGARSIRSRITLIVRKPKMTTLTLVSALLIAALAVGCTFGGAKEDVPSLSPYFGATYSMAEAPPVGLTVLSYAPTKDSIGEITITDNFFGAFDGDSLDWGENITNPVYTHIDFDQDAYGRSDLFYPTLEEFFGRYDSITVYEITNAAKPLHLLLLDDELWMAINVGNINCYILRLEKAGSSNAFDTAALLVLPESLREKVTVEEIPLEADNYAYYRMIKYYYTPDYDPDDAHTLGHSFTVIQYTPGGWERLYYGDGKYGLLGRDADFYYELHGPSDVQWSLENQEDYTQTTAALRNWIEEIFASSPAIHAVNLAETPFVDDFSYSGNHIDATIYPYNDMDDPDAVTWEAVLSQPVRQGEGGIWCVERICINSPSEVGGQSYLRCVLPGVSLSSADYYAQLQAVADEGGEINSFVAALTPEGALQRYIDHDYQLDSYAVRYGEMYSANKGSLRASAGAPITADTPAAFADAVYQSIVGTYESRDCYLTVESEEFGETRIHITEQNGYNLPNSLSFCQWSETEPNATCECAVTTVLTLSSPDGQTKLTCYEGCDSVSLTMDGKSYLLQSEDKLFSTLLQAANSALVAGLDDDIVIDGGITNYEEVVEQFARQFTANIAALPGWAASASEGVAYRDSGVTEAYFGEGTENFNSYYSLYFSPEMGMSDWQAGSGMEDVPDGEYKGWWVWLIGATFARSESGDWVCTGRYTGGDGLTYPTPLAEASIEELIHYLGHTTGYDHEYLIPYYICQQPASQLDELEEMLLASPEGDEFCTTLGRFLRDYGSYSDIQLTYEVLSGTLPKELAASLTEGYGA